MKKIKILGKNSSKRYLTANDSLSIEIGHAIIKENINNEARTILKEAIDNPEILVEFIKAKETKVIKSAYIKPILFLLGEQEGFLPPIKDFRAFVFILLINIFTPVKLKLGFSTPALFALNNEPVNIYFLSHQFHLWLSFINNLPGFEENTRKNFKNVWDSNIDSLEVNKLSIEEVLSLKDAIARDIEAIKFVKEMIREFVGQKQSLEKIKEGKSVNI